MKTETKKTDTKQQTKRNDDVAQLTDLEIDAVSGARYRRGGVYAVQIQML